MQNRKDHFSKKELGKPKPSSIVNLRTSMRRLFAFVFGLFAITSLLPKVGASSLRKESALNNREFSANDLENEYALKTAEIISYVDQNQDQVWPGFNFTRTPTIVHFDDANHLYAYHLNPKNANWTKLIIGSMPVYFMGEDPYGMEGDTYDYDVTIDDQSSFIVAQPFNLNDPINVIKNSYLACHERFHFYSAFESHFPPLQRRPFNGFDQLTNVKLTYLEINALKKYLSTDKENAETALQDAVAIHQFRGNLLNSDSLQYQKTMEVMEGITSYVGLKCVNVSDSEFIYQASSLLNGTECASSFSPKNIEGCLTNSRQYFTSAVAGRALEYKFTTSSWKVQAEKQGESLETILQAFYNMSLEEVAKRTYYAMENPGYDFNNIRKSIDSTYAPYLREKRNQEKQYTLEQGIELQIKTDDELDSTSDKSYVINTNLQLSINASGDYCSEDNTQKIHLSRISFLYKNVFLRFAPEQYWNRFKVSPDTTLIIDDSVNTTVGDYVAAQKNISAQHVSISNPQATISINTTGLIVDGTNNTLKIYSSHSTFFKLHRQSGTEAKSNLQKEDRLLKLG